MIFYLSLLTLAFFTLRLLVVLVNFLTKPLLKPYSGEIQEGAVSVLIPARNEEINIEKTLSHLLEQEYSALEILVLDDHSSDRTADIVQKLARTHPQLRLIQGKPLPKGWLGKNWACHQLAQEAKGAFLLFIDADVTVKPKLIPSALHYLEQKELALLSLFPDQEMQTWGEKITVPIMHYLLLTLLPLVFIERLPFPSMAAANGQFMLFRTSVYRRYHPHEQVRQQITEDIKIVQFLKKNHEKAATLLGNRLVICRMYTGLWDGINGFSKNLLEGFGNSFVGLFVYLFFITAAWVLVAWQVPFALLYLTLGTLLSNLMLASLSHQNWWVWVGLHPLKIGALVVIAFNAVRRKITRTNEWKGRKLHSD